MGLYTHSFVCFTNFTEAMTNDIVALIDYYEREKGIDRDRVIGALEYSFLSAYRKMVPGAEAIASLRAAVNAKKGEIVIWANLLVVEDAEVQDKFNQVPLSLARRRNEAVQVGDEMEFNVTPKDFGRIAVQTGKQTMAQRLRQAEKEMVYEEFKDRAGDIVHGTVRRFERNDVIIDLGKFEGVMPNRERVQGEEYNIGDRIRAYVLAVENEGKGPEIILSRSHPNFVRRLFEAEVSEIADRTVEIRNIVRESGGRTKLAVWSDDAKIDPVGSCVGVFGARVKNIVRELNNEKVDIIRWNDDPAVMVVEALKPAEIRSVTVDADARVVHVTVSEDQLSKAIGRKGQNARLTSRLIGWDVQVRKDDTREQMHQARLEGAAQTVGELLGLSDEQSIMLANAGGTDAQMIAGMEASDFVDILGVTETQAEEIAAKAALLAR